MFGVFPDTDSLRCLSAKMDDDKNAKKKLTSYFIRCCSRAEQAKGQYVKENKMKHYPQSLIAFTSSPTFRATSSNTFTLTPT